MRALRPGEDLLGGARASWWREWSGAFQADRLATEHLQPGSPDAAPWPVTPENRSRGAWYAGRIGRQRGIRVRRGQRPEHRTDPSGFERGAALLTLCPQRAGTTMADTRGIQEPQRAIALRTPLLEIEGMIGRTSQAPIRLWSKRGARESMRKRWASPLRWTVRNRRRRCCRRFKLIG